MKALTVTFLLTLLVLTGCASDFPTPTSTASPMPSSSDKTFSRLDAAGIEHIRESKTARLDMTPGKLSKESVGLEEGTSQAPDVLIKEGIMELIIEAPTGVISAKTDRLRLNGMNEGPDYGEVTFFLRAESFEDFAALIRDGVDRYGIPSESAERWIESMSSRPEDEGIFLWRRVRQQASGFLMTYAMTGPRTYK